MKRKILFITITYIIGILWGLYFNVNIALSLCFIILIIIFILIRRKVFIGILLFIIIISSIKSNSIKKIYNNMHFENEQITVTGLVIKKYETDSTYKKYLIKIRRINGKDNYNGFYMYIYVQNKNENLSEGKLVQINGIFSKATGSKNYKDFDYNEYLKSKKIIGILDCNNILIIGHNKSLGVFDIFNKFHENIKEKIYKILPEKEANLCIALILGDKDLIDEDIIDDFSKSSLSYVLAISGMHISYMIQFFSIIFDKLGRNKKKIIIGFVLIFYNIVIGYEISIIRATIMNCMYILSVLLNRKSDSITNLFFSALIVLIINPYSIKSFSFIFSFGGTLGIILFSRKIENCLIKIPIIGQRSKILDFIRKSISLSISANIIIMPVIIYYFNRLSILFIISGIIVNILLTIIIPLILIIIFISFLSIHLSNIMASVLKILLDLLIIISKIFSNDLFNFYIITPYEFSIITYYILIGLILFKSNSEKSIKRAINKYIKLIFIVYLIVALSFVITYKCDKSLNIYFIDVGQGDSTLIVTEKNKTILIDSGGSGVGEDEVGENTLLPYLLNRRISKLDYIMISHFDSDHCKAMLYIMDKINIKNAIISEQAEVSNNYEEFLEIAMKKKINIIIVRSGMRLNIDNNTYFDIIWPKQDFIKENALNNNSIVAKLNYKNKSILFTGDIEKIAEDKLISEYDLSADIIKIAHHGSKTSSSIEFISNVNPKIALIGVGENNKFGHPSSETIDTLNSVKCKVYRTDINGEINVNIDNNGKIRIKKHMN